MSLALPKPELLTRHQWIDREELEDLQNSLLRKMLSFAYKNVPYYHDRFKSSGLIPDSIESTKELSKLPVLSKSDIKSTETSKFLSHREQQSKVRKIRTSGTTGPPTVVYENKNEIKYRFRIRQRANAAIGLMISDKKATINFTYPKLDIQMLSLWNQIKWKLTMIRQHYSRNFYITYNCGEILEQILDYAPSALEAQPAYLQDVSKRLAGHNKLKLKAVISTGSLLAKCVKNDIESSLGAPVYDFYGGREFGLLAWQCTEREQYHLNSDVFFFEVLKDGDICAPGEQGNLLVTSLFNYTMPLIRYEIGDVVVLGDNSCPCGRTLPTIKSIEGRKREFFKLSDGSVMSPRKLVNLLGEIRDIPVYQIVCVSSNELIVKLFSKKVEDSLFQSVLSKLQVEFRGLMNITISQVQEEPRAKIRPIIPLGESIN